MSGVLRLFRRLLRDEGGAVAIMLTLSLIPLSIAAIGAVDLERGLSAKTQLQDALDAAALAALKASANDAALLQSTGAAAFAQNLGPAPDLKVASGPTFAYGDQGKVLADATASVDTIIASYVLGHPLNVAAHAEIVRSDVKLEIALVLDNSASMADNNKIGDLRIGATNFLNIMQTAATQRGDPNAVLVSLVPFSQNVRVDPANQGASWLDMKGRNATNNKIFSDPNTNRFSLFTKLGTTWAGCLESRIQPYDVQDDPAKGKDKLFTPWFWPDEYDVGSPVMNQYLNDASSADWKTRELNVTKYVATTGLNSGRGPNMQCVVEPLRPLTNNFATLRSDITKMQPTNNTNIPEGLVWGWHTISPNGPFATSGPVPVAPYGDPKHSKIAVLMTDGHNAFDPAGIGGYMNITPYEAPGYIWQGRLSKPDGTPLTSGSSDDTRIALDARLTKLCVNMKAKGIEIYAIAVGVEPQYQPVLKSCASGADHYYDVANGAGMIDAFNSIANQIANLHLSR